MSRFFYASLNGSRLGTAPALAMGALVALSFSIAGPFQLTALDIPLQTVLFGLYTGIAFATVVQLFVNHDHFAPELYIFRKSPVTGTFAALGAALGGCAFHFTGNQTPWFLFNTASLGQLQHMVAERPALAAGTFAAAWFLGKSISPPAWLAIMTLRPITMVDFMRGGAPHHDENAASTLAPAVHGQLHAKAAFWWTSRGEAPRARYEWSEARRLGGMREEDYAVCAAFYLATRDYVESERVLREGLAIYPHDPDLRYHLTTALEKQDLKAEAEEEYRRILDEHPDHALSLHALGNILGGQQRTKEALELYDRAVKAAERNLNNGSKGSQSWCRVSEEMPRYLNTRGAMFATLGHYEEAERDFRRTFQIGQEIYARTGKKVDGVSDAVKNMGMLHGMRRRFSRSSEDG